MSKKELVLLGRGKTYDGCPDNKEVWAVSCPRRDKWKVVDKIFLMDPIWEINAIPNHNTTGIVAKINEAKMPVCLQQVDADIPTSIEYPIEEVVNYFGNPVFFSNTICYMMALAIMEGYERIFFYGIDQSGQQEYISEKGCVEFWVGMARGRGVEVLIPKRSSVCRNVGKANFYGYRETSLVDILDKLRR